MADFFRIRIKKIDQDNEWKWLHKSTYQTYPDVFLKIHETLGPSRSRGGTPIEFEIEASNKGIFVLGKIIEKFDPWVTVEGHTRLDKSDIPQELFDIIWRGKNIEDRYTEIQDIEIKFPAIMREAEYFRVKIQEFRGNDCDYVNSIYHEYNEGFLEVYTSIQTNGTPSEFALSNKPKGLHILRKILERFDPWVLLTAVRRFDRVEMPDGLFKTVSEGGIGRHWTNQTEGRIKSLDWP